MLWYKVHVTELTHTGKHTEETNHFLIFCCEKKYFQQNFIIIYLTELWWTQIFWQKQYLFDPL